LESYWKLLFEKLDEQLTGTPLQNTPLPDQSAASTPSLHSTSGITASDNGQTDQVQEDANSLLSEIRRTLPPNLVEKIVKQFQIQQREA
jgi:hypothetical protein